MNHFPNPYDEEHRMTERRDTSEAGMLRRAAFRFEQRGQTASAILLKNAAWLLENPDTRLDTYLSEGHNAADGHMARTHPDV